MPYRLSEKAKADLRRIYRRGIVDFGEARADVYFTKLTNRFERLSEQPLLYPAAYEIDANLRKSVCGVDTVYYEVKEDSILIVRILSRQDRQTLL